VLDVGTFDGFYAFLAEHRGADRVVAVDNEQYRAWVRSRWGIELAGGEGFAAISDLLGSNVEYRRLDAFDLDRLGERFDVALCFGILHRVEDPGVLLGLLRERMHEGGMVLVETYGVRHDEGELVEHRPGDVYEGDAYVYWGFSAEGLDRLARPAGFEGFEQVCAPIVDGHPRILGTLHA
jgi:tRNA (mo5U34)-methyltransferase